MLSDTNILLLQGNHHSRDLLLCVDEKVQDFVFRSLQGDSTKTVPTGKIDNKNKLGDAAQEVLVDFKENPKAA
ncbi:hypothetical protein DEO72_LG8g927 [Vigna unguiculata]|uniref:Uncharacterized protein n=1 Tax=Vigna unguiculata TaxID=3917 RepID=A0A4D6MQH1_VIGUN|nr:hypothetical protein DEO72_LG8g927 [Vigna unguiculata]